VNVFRNLRSIYRALVSCQLEHDVVLANHSLTAWPVQLARSKAKRFYYIQAYEPDYYEARGGLSGLALRLLSCATYYFPLTRIVNSPVYFDYKRIRAKNFVPPGIDFSKFHPSFDKRPCAKSNRPIVIGCIGRAEPEKGTRYVVDAYRQLAAQGAPVALRVAFGNLPGGVADIPGVCVVVPRNDTELGEYYRSLDILIAPVTSQFGAPHYPVMEAMACGIPVITTGHLPANAQNSILVPPNDASAIVVAVKQLIEQPDLALKKRGQGLQDIQRYDWPTAARRMLSYFEQ
jgi:glycosyltransferase involved in cell wall biosynthesis